MAENNYIIGLGGTGGQAIAVFRKALFARREGDKDLLEGRKQHLEYLYIDSDKVDLDASACGSGYWATSMGDIRLKEYQRLDISNQEKFDFKAFQILPNVKRWTGEGMEIDQFPAHSFHGTGQRRRYGRMLFARKATDFDAIISQGIRRLQEESGDALDITYHIFASVGGGTGSGSLVDVVSYLCQRGENAGFRYRTFLYLFVGGAGAAISNSSYFYQNEYATLTDLNALMAGRYKPEIAAYPREVILNNRENPISGIYISSEHGLTNGRSLNQQVECMANACLALIDMEAGRTEEFYRPFIREELMDIISGEHTDMISSNFLGQEVVSYDVSKAERSYRFRTVGMSRCKEPVDEIRSILKCTLYQEIITYWLEGDAYKGVDNKGRIVTCEANRDIINDICVGEDKDMQHVQGSRLGKRMFEYNESILREFDELFCLSLPLKMKNPALTNTQFTSETLRIINEYIREAVKKIRLDAENTVRQARQVASEMQEMCEDEVGLYCSRIEQQLKERRTWTKCQSSQGGVWGLRDIIKYLENLDKKLRDSINREIKFVFCSDSMEERELQWRKIAGLTKLTAKPEKLYELHIKEARAAIYRSLQWREEHIRMMMRQWLREKIEKLKFRLIAKMRELEDLREHQQKMIMKCWDRIRRPSIDTVYLFETDRLEDHVRFLKGPDSASVIKNVLSKIDRMMEAKNQSDAPLENSYPKSEDLDEKQASSNGFSLWKESIKIHDDIVERRPEILKKVYHDSILEALYELSSIERESILRSLLHRRKPLAVVESEPLGGTVVVPTNITTPPPICDSSVSVPQLNSMSTSLWCFAEKLRRELEDMVDTKQSNVNYYVYPHEIRFMTVNYWMPARFFAVTRYL